MFVIRGLVWYMDRLKHDVLLWEVNWSRFVTLFKKSLLLAPDRRSDCNCSKMFTFLRTGLSKYFRKFPRLPRPNLHYGDLYSRFIVTVFLSCTVSEIWRVIFLPHLYLVPPLGLTPVEFHQGFWYQKKTRVPGLSHRVGGVMIGLCFSRV